jgi:hypothetical protein
LEKTCLGTYSHQRPQGESSLSQNSEGTLKAPAIPSPGPFCEVTWYRQKMILNIFCRSTLREAETLYPAAGAARSFHNAALMQRVEAQGANVMAMTNQAITRRTALSAAIGAIGTLPISNGKADDESPLRGPYKIEDWGNTWRNPSKARVLARVPSRSKGRRYEFHIPRRGRASSRKSASRSHRGRQAESSGDGAERQCRSEMRLTISCPADWGSAAITSIGIRMKLPRTCV